MVQARFINDTKTVDVHGENQETSVSVVSKIDEKRVGVNSTARHDTLTGRDLPNQHPIDAITGLRDIINKMWTYIHEQEIAETVWVVNHNLGRHPSFVVVDTAGNVQVPDEVTYNSENQITFQFISAFAGKAYFN